MCDYSLHLVASRPAKVGDKLVATDFVKSITGGFAAVGEPDVAVCLLPGTELAFEENVQYQRAFSLFGRACVDHKVARFRQVNMHDPHVHHDALEFPDGQIVMVTRLVAGQREGECAGEFHRTDRGLTPHRRQRNNRILAAQPAEEGASIVLCRGDQSSRANVRATPRHVRDG